MKTSNLVRYRALAEQARLVAGATSTHAVAEALLDMAAEYDRKADEIEHHIRLTASLAPLPVP